LKEVLKVDQQDILAFGDGENDREMMLCVGHSVAMGNAIQSIKDIADTIADTNKNKGVAKELVKIFSLVH
jgi:hydroxymethylpyrimidine pyrophosphatase-like HAD family hydrolase